MMDIQKTIHIWLLPIDDITTENMPIQSFLNERDLVRLSSIRAPSRKLEFVYSRLLLSAALYYFLPNAPKKVIVIPDKYGRPFWQYNGSRLSFYFSLSHTSGMVALALSDTMEIGCDIEKIRPRRYQEALCDMVFTTNEISFYNQHNDTNDALLFFYKAWTLKEASVKALGTGLRTPLTSIESLFSENIETKESSAFFSDKKWCSYSEKIASDYMFAAVSSYPKREYIITRKSIDVLYDILELN